MTIAEFPRRRSLTLLFLGLPIIAAVWVADAGRFALALSAVTLPLGVVDFFWQLRTPLVAIHPGEIVLHVALVRPTQRLSFPEIAAWAHTDSWVAFERLDAKRTWVHLMPLARADRERLIQHLHELGLGQPGYAGVTAADIAAHARRLWLWAGLGTGVALLGSLAVVLWALFCLGH